MSNDFEVTPIGYMKEIRLSRELSQTIEQNLHTLPKDVQLAYARLKQHYQWQQEQGLA